MYLALNNQQGLMYHRAQLTNQPTNQTIIGDGWFYGSADFVKSQLTKLTRCRWGCTCLSAKKELVNSAALARWAEKYFLSGYLS